MFEALTDRFDDVFRKLRGRGRITEDNVHEVFKQFRPGDQTIFGHVAHQDDGNPPGLCHMLEAGGVPCIYEQMRNLANPNGYFEPKPGFFEDPEYAKQIEGKAVKVIDFDARVPDLIYLTGLRVIVTSRDAWEVCESITPKMGSGRKMNTRIATRIPARTCKRIQCLSQSGPGRAKTT